jgi:hypothetical protein
VRLGRIFDHVHDHAGAAKGCDQAIELRGGGTLRGGLSKHRLPRLKPVRRQRLGVGAETHRTNHQNVRCALQLFAVHDADPRKNSAAP